MDPQGAQHLHFSGQAHSTLITRRCGGVTIVGVVGRLTLEDGGAATLREHVRQQLAAGNRNILVDLSCCDYIDTAGLGELATALIRIRTDGGRFTLFGATRRVRALLRASRLLYVFEMFDNEAHARAALGEPLA